MRTIPPAKAIKTERTHEENQERAYIAASRRSDRSLEARVESARRASEIHKRRTGRSLRVTEQDVINEEMYEEEDDDLPLQYRRLTAHLQTGSADFNRRLAAYLTNQVAMRSAMDQMVQNSYAQSYPGNPQYPQNTFQSPMMPQHGLVQSPMSPYRPGPYPSPHQPNFRNMHNRAYSTATAPNAPNTPSTPSTQNRALEQRRMSTPAGAVKTNQIKTEGQSDADYARQSQSATLPMGTYPPLWQDMGPFSTTLPPDAQQMLGPAMDMNDPFQASLMSGSESYISSPYYPWGDTSSGVNGMPVHPSAWKGMSTTLAPSALGHTPEHASSSTSPGTPALISTDNTAPSSGLDFGFGSQETKGLHIHNMPYPSIEDSQSGLTSGQQSPSDGFWDNYVQDATWHEETTT